MTDYYLSPPAAPASGEDVRSGTYNRLNTNTFGIAIRFRIASNADSGYLFSSYQAFVAITTLGYVTVGIRVAQGGIPESSNWSFLTIASAVSTGTWHTLVVARNTSKTESRVYLDGVNIGNLTTSAASVSNVFMSDPSVELSLSSRGSSAADMSPAQGGTTVNFYFRGDLNDVAVWRSVVLTAADATNLAAAAAGTWDTVVAAPINYWIWDTQTTVDIGSDALATTTPTGVTYATDAPAFSISPGALPAGVVGTAYNQTLTALNGGAGPYTWSITAGSLPTGLTLGPSVTSTIDLTGTPTQFGVYNFTVEVTDSLLTASQAYSVSITAGVITITPATAHPGRVGLAYSVGFTASGGFGATTWSIAGSIPGLSFDTGSGVLSGTPLGGSGTVTVFALKDGGNYFGQQNYTIGIADASVTISPPVIPGGLVGTPYSEVLTQPTSILPSVSWGFFDGVLPPGLSLASGVSATLSGTPTLAGVYPFTVYVYDPESIPSIYGEVNYSVVVSAVGLTVEPDFVDSDAVIYDPEVILTPILYPDYVPSTGWIGTPIVTHNPLPLRSSFLTQRGPLVKDWGDWTPATVDDVAVFVDGLEVPVASVNPYHGEITLVDPVAPSADIDVRVDYKWIPSPIMKMRLNTIGLGLNKSDHRRGLRKNTTESSEAFGAGLRSTAQHGDQIQDADHPKGAVRTSRFPMTVVLGNGLGQRPKPLMISHRYLGFQRGYTATLNNSTSLRLNQPPNRVAKQSFVRNPSGIAEVYEGILQPTLSDPAWALTGTDSGQVNLNLGTYTLVDARSGSFVPSDPTVAFYSRTADLTFPASIYVVGRFLVDEVSLFDGVFSGVGFGVHNNLRLWLAGALEINGVRHVGLLMDAERPDLRVSWKVGPTSTATIRSSTEATFETAQVPLGILNGHRFQILTGTQAGVYTVSDVVYALDGLTYCTVSPAFPADFTRYGNQYPEAAWEVDWSENLTTYRLEVATARDLATLKVSGAVTGTVAVLDVSASVPRPAGTLLMLSTAQTGQAFWGSLSAAATNRSTWSFYRYGVVPDFATLRTSSQTVAAEMTELPEYLTYNPWFVTQQFGYAIPGSSLLLKSTSANPTLDFSFGYERIEPFLLPPAYVDLQTLFQVDSGTLGSGDAQIVLRDTVREVRLGTLLYVENGSGLNYRRLIQLPSVSFAGLLSPESQGWEAVSTPTITTNHEGPVFQMTQTSEQSGVYTQDLDLNDLDFTPSDGRVFEARFAVLSYTAPGDETGLGFLADVDSRPIRVRLWAGVTPLVQLLNTSGTVIQSYSFDWTDGLPHTYRVVADRDGNTVTVFLDDVAQVPTLAVTDFGVGGGDIRCSFGVFTSSVGVASVSEWYSVSCQAMPPSDAKRTLGIWKGGDLTSINSWEIPRTDSSTAPNSMQTGPVIEEMDWRSPIELRVFRSPTWGVTVYRPDLPLPPYYSAEVYGVPGTGFATQTTEPSAGWINVETPNLPLVSSVFGSVSFGALNPLAVTQQRWEHVRYRLYRPPTANHQAPQGMVLNRATVVTSGDIYRDKHMETVVMKTSDSRTVSLWVAHQKADDVFKVLDGETSYVRDSWVFDKDAQTITLNEGLAFVNPTVTVIFNPGKPSTSTYLKNQPVLEGLTRLNEGTPPVPKGQTINAFRVEANRLAPTDIPGRVTETGYSPNDPSGVPDSSAFETADTNRLANFVVPSSVLYEKMKFIEVPDDGEKGLIAPLNDHDDLLPEGLSGGIANETEAEPIYSLTGVGAALVAVGYSAGLRETGSTVTRAVGGKVLSLSGTMLIEQRVAHTPALDTGVTTPARFMILGGGSYRGPVVDNAGLITGRASLGAVLGGTSHLYPSLEATRQNLWAAHLSEDETYAIEEDLLVGIVES